MDFVIAPRPSLRWLICTLYPVATRFQVHLSILIYSWYRIIWKTLVLTGVHPARCTKSWRISCCAFTNPGEAYALTTTTRQEHKAESSFHEEKFFASVLGLCGTADFRSISSCSFRSLSSLLHFNCDWTKINDSKNSGPARNVGWT